MIKDVLWEAYYQHELIDQFQYQDAMNYLDSLEDEVSTLKIEVAHLERLNYGLQQIVDECEGCK